MRVKPKKLAWNRFRKNRRAYYSLLALIFCSAVSLFAEVIANENPLLLRFKGQWYFPALRFYPASEFGQSASFAPDYKALCGSPDFRNHGWALLAPIPFGPDETIADLATPPPVAPSLTHWLGTDDRGRDLFVRLLYGGRNSLLFAVVSWAWIALLGSSIGAAQGFFGGRTDFFIQRGSEIWNALPILYVVLFLLSLFPPSLWLLAAVWVAFSWIPLAGYVRAEVLRVRNQEYIAAARALGAGRRGLLFKHVLPNSLTPLMTLSPFLIAASIAALSALDYLGMGLPPPAASWGELLHEGKENLSSWWLAFFPFFTLFATLCLLSFVGEGAREALGVKSQVGP